MSGGLGGDLVPGLALEKIGWRYGLVCGLGVAYVLEIVFFVVKTNFSGCFVPRLQSSGIKT